MSNSRLTNTSRPWGRAVGTAILGFGMSVVALVCVKLGSLPWDVQWLDGQSVNADVLRVLASSQYALAAAALVTLNFMLLFFRLARRQTSELSALDAGSVTLNRCVDGAMARDVDYDAFDFPAIDASVEAAGLAHRRVENLNAEVQIATDEISRLRRELVRCKQQLIEADKSKVQLLTTVSDELRTPMNGIVHMTDLLLGGSLMAPEERYVRSIAASSTSQLATLDDLLDLSKIESGILKLEHGRFSVRDCVEDVRVSLTAKARAKPIELMFYVDENVPRHMEGDSGRVRQVLSNLVSNAIAFSHEGEVVVRLSCKGVKTGKAGKSVYQCDVQDTGVGIGPELQIELYEAFAQAGVSKTRDHSVLGRGLSITRELVSMMNGEISFRSRLGEGSLFSFTMELDDVSELGDADIINLKAIETIKGLQRPGKPDLLGKVIDVYVDKSPEVIGSMRTGLDVEDYELIIDGAHSLKSSSAYVGADVLSRSCGDVESAIADNRYAELEPLITAIETDYALVATALADILAKGNRAA